MPKRVVHITWACKYCYQEHDAKAAALTCENSGLALPEFKRWDLVLVKLDSGKEIIGEIVNYGPDEGFLNPHELPGYYDVNVAYGDYNPHNYKPRDYNPFRRYSITVSRDKMKPYRIRSKSACPMCRSTVIKREVEELYSPYYFPQFGFMKNIELSRCGNCGLYFFNKKQNEVVTAKILVKLKGKKLADTKKLVREHRYQYS